MGITQRDLEAQVNDLNKMAGFDNPEYSTIGSYVLNYANGRVALYRYMNNSGGVQDVLRVSHVPKRELYGLISAYRIGLSEHDETKT